jgi:hypothetical protein
MSVSEQAGVSRHPTTTLACVSGRNSPSLRFRLRVPATHATATATATATTTATATATAAAVGPVFDVCP